MFNSNNNNYEKYYDEFGNVYFEGRQNGKFIFNEYIEAPSVKNLIEQAKLPTNENVLDIGCGFGYFTKYLAEKHFEITAIDISKKMIDAAKIYCQDYKSITYLNCPLKEAILPQDSYQIILGSFMLGYFDDLIDLFKIVAKVMNHQSIAIFSMLHPIVESKSRRDRNGYFIHNYFSEGYFESDFLSDTHLLKLKKWFLKDLFEACKENCLYVEEVIEPRIIDTKKLSSETIDFYKKCPSVIIFKIKKLINSVDKI